MKKFFTVSMMALALVLASSCNKEENSADNNAKYVNTWVAKDLSVSQIIKEISAGDSTVDDIIGSLPEEQKNLILNQKLNAVMKLDENGKGNFGLHLDNNTYALFKALYSWYSEQEGAEIPSAVSELVAKIKVNDYVGLSFTYVAVPTDETTGKIDFTVQVDKDKPETSTVEYSKLSDSTITLSYEEKDASTGKTNSFSYDFNSLGTTTGITVGNFIDLSVLASLFPDSDEE